jgi:hypothetical protein
MMATAAITIAIKRTAIDDIITVFLLNFTVCSNSAYSVIPQHYSAPFSLL